jgi:hypothetical protein
VANRSNRAVFKTRKPKGIAQSRTAEGAEPKLEKSLRLIFAPQIDQNKFGILNFGLCNLPFDLAQGGELVEPFDIGDLLLEIS